MLKIGVSKTDGPDVLEAVTISVSSDRAGPDPRRRRGRRGQLRMGATTNFVLRDAASAHRALEGRTTQGKLALIPER